MILDAGFLVSVDRGEDAARAFLIAADRGGKDLHTTHPVVAQVWRDGGRQARLAGLLKSAVSVHAFEDGAAVGRLLALAGTSDVVDAHLVATAVRLGDDILTGDVRDLTLLAKTLGPAAPTIHHW